MDFKKLFTNNKAVSPVIGVILMVAITVILAAAIGSTVFGEGTATPAPQASLSVQPSGPYGTTASNALIKFEHLGGDTINIGSSSTKILIYANGASKEYTAVNTGTGDTTTSLTVGDIKTFKFDTPGTSPTTLGAKSGDTINVKFIDLSSGQIYFDRDVTF